jgi:ABC-2 type transport system ATP-binding protein
MPLHVLQVTNLSKTYPPEHKGDEPFVAVDSLSFHIKKGEILGLLGPNGAGKSTTIQMLLGLTSPSSGQISYFGQDFVTHRESILERINFASAYAHVQGKLTVKQNLTIYGMLYNVQNLPKKIAELAELLEISHLLNTTFWHLSSGQQTRVILAKSMINDSQLLLMDEPTASLDPDIVDKMIDLIRSMQKEKGVSILFTSHNMEEVTRLCDRVIFMHAGKIVAEDTPLELTKLVGDAQLVVSYDSGKKIISEYLAKENLVHTFPNAQVVQITLTESQIPSTLFDLKKLGIWIVDIDIKKPTLEDVFLSFARKAQS